MSLYSIALFLHIVGALLLFALLTIEGFTLRSGISGARFSRILGPISAVLILVPGLYMVATTWGWKPWIAVGVTSWLLIAVGSALTGISVIRGRMSRDAATVSWLARLGMTLGVVFDMTVKPDALPAVTAVVIGLLAGAAAGLATRREVSST